MKERAVQLLGGKGVSRKADSPKQPEISTFHSLCVRILRRNITHLGYPAGYGICDRGDQESIARTVLREIKVAEGQLKPGDLLYLIGRWKNNSIRPEEAVADRPDRQGASRRVGLSPLSAGSQGGGHGRF